VTDKSLEEFLEAVRSSCTTHAQRKGYASEDGDKLGPVLEDMGVIVDHGIGEIVTKLMEYRVTQKRVLLEKIAGWAWTLWKRTK
jgi:hypothetical protein